jgi:hypothetical protein
MPIIKSAALAKARSNFDVFAEAKDGRDLETLFKGAIGYCRALQRNGVISEDELARLLNEADQARDSWSYLHRSTAK